MKLSEIRKAYEELSGKLSDIVRQLAFAGIGIIWIFRINGTNNSILIPKELSIPLIFLIITFVLDILQYLISTIIWYFFYCKERKDGKKEDEEVQEKEVWNIPSWIIIFLKTITLMVAYIFLFIRVFCAVIQ